MRYTPGVASSSLGSLVNLKYKSNYDFPKITMRSIMITNQWTIITIMVAVTTHTPILSLLCLNICQHEISFNQYSQGRQSVRIYSKFFASPFPRSPTRLT